MPESGKESEEVLQDLSVKQEINELEREVRDAMGTEVPNSLPFELGVLESELQVLRSIYSLATLKECGGPAMKEKVLLELAMMLDKLGGYVDNLRQISNQENAPEASPEPEVLPFKPRSSEGSSED